MPQAGYSCHQTALQWQQSLVWVGFLRVPQQQLVVDCTAVKLLHACLQYAGLNADNLNWSMPMRKAMLASCSYQQAAAPAQAKQPCRHSHL